MPRTDQNYPTSTAEAVYDVTTQITELRMPAVKGYTEAEVSFDGGPSISPNPSLGRVNTIDGPFIPLKTAPALLKVETNLVGAGTTTTTQYLFYELTPGFYNFYTSPNADGSEAVAIGTVATTSPDPSKTTQKAEYLQPDPAKPVIVIGDIVIDPPVKS